MRKRHQAILISENAKNKIINELLLVGRTEIEQQYKLNNFYEEFIPENDIEVAPKNKTNTLIKDQSTKLIQFEDNNNNNEDFDNDGSDCEDSVVLKDIKLPSYDDKDKKSLPNIKFQIINNAELSQINFDKSNYIEEKKIKISTSKNANLSKLYNKANEKLREKDKSKDKFKNLDIRQSKTVSSKRKERNALTENNQNKKNFLDTYGNVNDTDINFAIENSRLSNCGPELNFKDIMKQLVFWTEESKNKSSNKGSGEGRGKKGKKKRGSVMYEIKINIDMILPKVNGFQLFNINPKHILKIKEKIMEIQKQMKNKEKLSENDRGIINVFLEFQNEIINEHNQNISRIANELENIDNIVYGDNWSIIKFKK